MNEKNMQDLLTQKRLELQYLKDEKNALEQKLQDFDSNIYRVHGQILLLINLIKDEHDAVKSSRQLNPDVDAYTHDPADQ